VRRYLAAFGPASVKDIATWSGLTGVREIVERLRKGLRTFRDANGVELLDVPDAPVADPATLAPVRFLAEYDNVFLSHSDRSRIVDSADRPRFGGWDGRFFKIVLVDGFIRAIWRSEDGDVVVKPVRRLSKKDAAAVEAEGRRLAGFLGAGEVRILPA
jgi:Winged helix DNA-binding domain